MMKPKVVLGCVVDEEGVPVKGAFVVVEHSSVPAIDIAIVTGESGFFKIALPGGDCWISATTKSGMKGVKKISKYNSSVLTPTICVHN